MTALYFLGIAFLAGGYATSIEQGLVDHPPPFWQVFVVAVLWPVLVVAYVVELATRGSPR